MATLTTSQVAARLGISTRRVRQIANSRGVRPQMRGNRATWHSSQLPSLQRRPVGRPAAQPPIIIRLNSAQACELLHVEAATLAKIRTRGELPNTYNNGRHWRYDRDDIAAYKARCFVPSEHDLRSADGVRAFFRSRPTRLVIACALESLGIPAPIGPHGFRAKAKQLLRYELKRSPTARRNKRKPIDLRQPAGLAANLQQPSPEDELAAIGQQYERNRWLQQIIRKRHSRRG